MTKSGNSKGAKGSGDSTIAVNRKARFNFHIEDDFEAGLCLEGWEVKSLREGRANLTEAYVFVRNGEVFITGCNIAPLPTASTHITPNPTRQRKLLLNRIEIDRISGAVDRKGYTLVPLKLYWKKGRAKLLLGLAKGKKEHDKRADTKDRDWKRQQARILKNK
ncbi:MAG: SsrA-binding protein SmpB [Gammaproteobacteria bacterium]|nr:SsrA-binding protein SmpB [Gammaproteobacteria bacterium]NND53534.1 SsrA-binding protein SmpB [Gammaproteobacteria bacterium]